MATRHEEKYIINYLQYLEIRNRTAGIFMRDRNGEEGSYIINSLYYDDHMDTALLEKLDGLPEHSKFRVRCYDYSDRVVRLERKDKHGILTEKCSADIAREQIGLLGKESLGEESSRAYGLTVQMQTAGLIPVIAVRYKREAFVYAPADLRITFDTNIEAIRPDMEALFDPGISGVPVLEGNSVIMEIKYSNYLPGFVRKLTSVGGKQLSFSKYALCRERFIT